MKEKVCTKCGETKSLDNFYRTNSTRDGYRGDCKACFAIRRRARYDKTSEVERVKRWREANQEQFREYQRMYRARPARKRAMRDLYYRRTFGISADEFDELLAMQGGRCAICGTKPERAASLHLDHDHVTGAVRATLCLSCNQGIGKFRDDPELLERAAAYLRGELLMSPDARADTG